VGGTNVNNGGAIVASSYTGLDTVALKNVVDATGVTINALATGSTVALSGSTAATVGANFAAAATAANVTANGLTAANVVNVAGAALTTVNFSGDTGLVTGAGQVSIIDNNGTADTVTTVNIKATGASNLVVAGDKVATIDASASTAAVKLAIGAVAADLTVKGGAGNDVVTLDLATLSAKDSIDLGAGSDNAVFTIDSTSAGTLGTNASVAAAVVSIATGAGVGYELLNKVGAEQITFNATVVADTLSIDASKLTANKIGLQDTALVTKLLNADTIVSDVNGTTLSLQGLRDASDATKFAADAGTVNVVSQDKGESVTVAANSGTATTSDFSKLVLTGAGDVVFNNATAGKASTVDASGLAGALGFTAGAKVENVTLGAGKDILTFGTGSSTYAATDVVKGFGAGDKLDLGLAAKTDFIKFDATAAGSVSFEQAITQAAAATGVNDGSKAAWFTWTDGNTYVVQDWDTKAVIDQTSADVVIKLVGALSLTADASGEVIVG